MTTADLKARIAATIRPDVQRAQTYVVPAVVPNAVKLDAMENPYRLPQALQQALGQRLGQVAINRYPGPSLPALKAALAEHAQLPAGCELMLGNGSDELITLLTLACMRPGATVLAPEPGFVMYHMAAQWQGLPYVGVPLRPDFSLDAEAMVAAVQRHRPALTFLAYPNNPTANLFDPQAMQRVIDQVGAQGHGWVVVDEAYQPFASDSWMARMAHQPHVLVMRTLSKFGLAGIRLGYLCGHAPVIAQLDKVRPPYNVSALNAEAALFALEHAAHYTEQAAAIRQSREALLQQLAQLPGCTVFPSQGNMVLMRVPDASRWHQHLMHQGILVKNVSTMHPLLSECLRLTVGTPEENTALIQALKAAP